MGANENEGGKINERRRNRERERKKNGRNGWLGARKIGCEDKKRGRGREERSGAGGRRKETKRLVAGNKGDIRSRIGITAVVLWTFGCHEMEIIIVG